MKNGGKNIVLVLFTNKYIYYLLINAARIFCLTRGLARSWRNGDAQCCQLCNIADPFRDFFLLQKSAQTLFRFWESLVLPTQARGLALSARAHTSLSLCVSSVKRATAEVQRSQLNNILCCFSNFTCKYSQNQSTAIVFILCVFDFIRRRLDYQDFCAD